ncbi:DNA methyltransferase [Methylorubrum thiocyanatum]|uniref:DNA methyltransferase n=1 Tax=Methylorubrum thiocyanatum TaxID=47958 RepID=UPI0035C87E35
MTRAIGSAAVLRTEAALVVEGDSLPVLQDIPDGSISLIVTDPPYHATKKHNIFGDTKFEDDDQYLAWLALYVREWRRILRPNGLTLPPVCPRS